MQSSSINARARSDPTHQHHSQHHTQSSHSAAHHQGAVPAGHVTTTQYTGSTMECESPNATAGHHTSGYSGSTQQSWLPTGTVETQHGGRYHGHIPSVRHHQSPPQMQVTGVPVHLGGHLAQPVLTDTTNPPVLLGSTAAYTNNAGTMSSFSSRQNNFPVTGGNVGVDLTTSVVQPHVTGIAPPPGGGTEPSSMTSSVNMQFGAYQAPTQYGQFQQQTWPTSANFPFSIQANAPPPTLVGGHEPVVTQHSSRTSQVAEQRGEESPMHGVCVQQSPVASH